MPTLPKWVANGVEKVFSRFLHPVAVTHTQLLDSHLKLVRFEGDLSKTKFTPGNVIEFRVNETDFRHYTPSWFDKEAGVCEVIFYLHNLGVGSQWASNLQVGDQVKLMGPGGKVSFQPNHPFHVCMGDESSLGLALNLQQAAQQQKRPLTCLLELDHPHRHWGQLLELKAQVVPKSNKQPAQEAIQFLDKIDTQVWQNQWKQAFFYLTGRAKSIQNFRLALKQKGILPNQIVTQPYWADHKKGL